jgi:hypothetical protein
MPRDGEQFEVPRVALFTITQVFTIARNKRSVPFKISGKGKSGI